MRSIRNNNNIKNIYIKVFFSAFFMFIIGVLPILIVSKGRYLFFSDYNAQIIPFWRYINESVKNGAPVMDYNRLPRKLPHTVCQNLWRYALSSS